MSSSPSGRFNFSTKPLITYYPNLTLPQRYQQPFVRRNVARGVEGIYSRLNQNQMSVPQTFGCGAGSNNLDDMSTMQRIDGSHGGGNGIGALVACSLPELSLEKFELLFALLASHAALFSDQRRLFAEGQRQRLER